MKIKRAHKRTIGRGIVFLMAVAILTAFFVGVASLTIFLSTRLHGFSYPDTYTFKVGMDSTSVSKLKSHTYKMGSFYDHETVYVNFTILREYCGFYESGDRKEFRYILPIDGSHFTVKDQSARVNMNGNIIYMNAPAIVSDGQLYLPLNFVDEYISGISIEHQKKTETDEETGEKIEVEQEFIYVIRCNEKNEYSLLLQPTENCLPIDTSAIQ